METCAWVEMEDSKNPKARIVEITEDEQGQRIDNFLFKTLKGVPKTRIYKAVRSGEVRVNGSRIKVFHKLKIGDKVRIPPIRHGVTNQSVVVPPNLLNQIPVLFEDEYFLVVDKPAGLAVHGGTGIDFGLIEAFRQLRTSLPYLELVHRLDRETSGCIMLAKSRNALLSLQKQLGEERSIGKFYRALVTGDCRGGWQKNSRTVRLALSRQVGPGIEKRSVVDRNGQSALSKISVLEQYAGSALVEIELKTGRMHQARAHCAAIGHPIVGDKIYGDDEINTKFKKKGLGRMFLHSYRLNIRHPVTGVEMALHADLPPALKNVLANLELF